MFVRTSALSGSKKYECTKGLPVCECNIKYCGCADKSCMSMHGNSLMMFLRWFRSIFAVQMIPQLIKYGSMMFLRHPGCRNPTEPDETRPYYLEPELGRLSLPGAPKSVRPPMLRLRHFFRITSSHGQDFDSSFKQSLEPRIANFQKRVEMLKV